MDTTNDAKSLDTDIQQLNLYSHLLPERPRQPDEWDSRTPTVTTTTTAPPVVYPELYFREALCQEWKPFDMQRLEKGVADREDLYSVDHSQYRSGNTKPINILAFGYNGCLVEVSDTGHVEISCPKREELIVACHDLEPFLAKYVVPSTGAAQLKNLRY